MWKSISKILWFGFLIGVLGCSPGDVDKVNVIPLPFSVEKNKGLFQFDQDTKITYTDDKLKETAMLLSADIFHHFHKGYEVMKAPAPGENTIHLSLGKCNAEVGAEGYVLEANKSGVNICANLEAGLFYGTQTLLQLIPKEKDTILRVPSVRIEDKPRFYYRGLSLDIATHFIDKEGIKRVVDMLAIHKMNVLQLKLINDYGFRIEIDGYPELTRVGAWREDRRDEPWTILENQRPPYDESKPFYGGFLTIEDMKEIVRYARERHVRVIPEISFPGFVLPVLAAYPGLSCTGESRSIPGGKLDEVSAPVCVGNDSTMALFKAVVDQFVDIFPAEYIYYSGVSFNLESWKKCPKCQMMKDSLALADEKDLQRYYIGQLADYILSRGKNIIANNRMMWQGLDPGTIFKMPENELLETVLGAGHRVIMSDASAHALHSYQDNANNEQESFPLTISLQDAYKDQFFPVDLHLDKQSRIIGMEASLKTDFIHSLPEAEVKLLPRLCALAENCWSFQEEKDFDQFEKRLVKHFVFLSKMGFNYYLPPPAGIEDKVIYGGDNFFEMVPPEKYLEMRYTTNGSEPTMNSEKYIKPIPINETMVLKVKCFLPHGASSATKTARFSKTPPREPVKNPVNLYQGVKYKLHLGRFHSVNEITDSSFAREGILTEIGIPPTVPGNFFGLIIDAFIYIEEEGVYSFYLSSDDGSKLLVDEEVVIDNDGIHGKGFKEGQVSLKPGYHLLRVKYFDLNLNEILELEYEGPGVPRQAINKSLLFYNKLQ